MTTDDRIGIFDKYMAFCVNSSKLSRRVIILALPGTPLTSISAAVDVFKNASEMWGRIMAEKRVNPFDVILVSPDGQNIQCMGGIGIEIKTAMSEIDSADLVIITALLSCYESQRVLPDIRNWLLQMYSNGAMLASFCTGAFVLASTGLLDGKTATTHWASAQRLARMYPEIRVLPHRLITDEGTLFTSGGSHGAVDFEPLSG